MARVLAMLTLVMTLQGTMKMTTSTTIEIVMTMNMITTPMMVTI
jgi:hypothetical protein